MGVDVSTCNGTIGEGVSSRDADDTGYCPDDDGDDDDDDDDDRRPLVTK